MSRGAWRCVTIGAAVCAVAPAVLAAYLAAYPLPADCGPARVVCRWVIPPEYFRPDGTLGPPVLPRLWPDALDVSAPPVVMMTIPAPGASALLPAALLALWLRHRRGSDRSRP